MSSYPSNSVSFREKNNLPGMTYDASKKTTLYVEDLSTIENEIIAIENELGASPKGTEVSVAARLDNIDTVIAGKQNSLGYTAENTSNKDTTAALGSSDTKYPSQKAVKTYVDNIVNAVKSAMYPINSIYINYSNATNPATLLGFGTWVAIEGRVLVGKSASGTFATAGATGGAETHTLTEAQMPWHTHSQNAHAHEQVVTNPGAGGPGIRNDYDTDGPAYTYPQGVFTSHVTATNNYTGGSQPHNNLQPYVVVYIWRRTA